MRADPAVLYRAPRDEDPFPALLGLVQALNAVREVHAAQLREAFPGPLDQVEAAEPPPELLPGLAAVIAEVEDVAAEVRRFEAIMLWGGPRVRREPEGAPFRHPELTEALHRLGRRTAFFMAALRRWFCAALADAEAMDGAALEVAAGRAVVTPEGDVVARGKAGGR